MMSVGCDGQAEKDRGGLTKVLNSNQMVDGTMQII